LLVSDVFCLMYSVLLAEVEQSIFSIAQPLQPFFTIATLCHSSISPSPQLGMLSLPTKVLDPLACMNRPTLLPCMKVMMSKSVRQPCIGFIQPYNLSHRSCTFPWPCKVQAADMQTLAPHTSPCSTTAALSLATSIPLLTLV
jgi:hypothetical protein